MKNILTKIVLLALIFSNSCAFLERQPKKIELEPLNYLKNSKVKMDYKSFFDKKLEGFAIKMDKNNNIISSYKVEINASWDKNKGVVKNNYTYFDGKKDSRTWLVTINDDKTYEAIGHDMIKPVYGRQSGNMAIANYSLKIGKPNSQEILFTDKMYLIDDKSMIIIQDYKKSKTKSKNISQDDYGKTIFSLKKVEEIE